MNSDNQRGAGCVIHNTIDVAPNEETFKRGSGFLALICGFSVLVITS
jgi:hypothetical protein